MTIISTDRIYGVVKGVKQMARWHIDKNGQLCRCMAIFRACPRKMHFDSEVEGQAYISNGIATE